MRKRRLRIDDLQVWRRGEHPTGYQRNLSEAHIARISRASFDKKSLGLPVVSQRKDGSLWIVNGQHRIELARRNGHSAIDCWVHENLSVQEEAAMYRRLNESRNPTALDKFNAGRVEKDPKVLRIIREGRKHGYEIGTSMTCVSAVQRLDYADSKILDRTLSALASMWPEDIPPASVVAATGMVFQRHDGAIREKRLVQMMRKKFSNPDVLIGKARALRAARGGSITTNIADVILGTYNGQIRPANRLELFKP